MKFEYLGGSEVKERGYNSERVKISEKAKKGLGHGAILSSDLVF